MPLIKRSEFRALLADREQLAACHLYLFFGERYLCREAADQLEQALVSLGPATVSPVDGDQEDAAQTLARLMSFSLLPGRQIYRVTDSRLLHSGNVAETLWDKAVQSQASGHSATAMRHLLSLARLAAIDIDQGTAFSSLTADQWQQHFGFAKPGDDLSWADRLFTQAIGSGKQAGAENANLAEQYISAFTRGVPPSSYLLLTAEAVDKRQRLFTFIKKSGLAIDCSVSTGASSAVQKEQKDILKEVVLQRLAELEKKIDPQALDMLFDRTGFHPVAAVMEAEKLAMYCGERAHIYREDVELMVGRTREDALYELTDAFGKGQLGRTLTILAHLQENGTHALAIIATMRNYFRKLLLFRSLQGLPVPAWQTGMSAQNFQNKYLPALKELAQYTELLQGHPYALFVTFSKAAQHSSARLQHCLELLLNAEFRLKGSPLPAGIVLEELFVSLLPRRQ